MGNWEAVELDGCSPVTNYIVERKLSTSKAWTLVSEEVEREQYNVVNLSTGEPYQFRVCAVNKFGKGDEAITKAVRCSEVPSMPQQLEVVDITKETISLVWTKPESDG